MPETPAQWRAIWRDETTVIVIGSDTDNGQPHTVCEIHVCDDGTHPDRQWADANLIVRLRNLAATTTVTDLLAEIDRLQGEVKFWREQQKLAADVAAGIADLDEEAPALRQMLGTERGRRKRIEEHADKVLYALAEAGIDVASYDHMADGVRRLVRGLDAARRCVRCGTSWNADIDTCPQCQDGAAPSTAEGPQ